MQLLGTLQRANLPNCALVVAVMGPLFGLACTHGPVGNQQTRPDVLMVLPGAIDIQDTDENDGTVLYQLNEEFPALPVIQTLTGRLEANGWRPRREDLLNPGLLTSLVGGWQSHEDRTQGRTTQVYQWVGQWEDDAERVVWYVLTYDAVTGSDGSIRARGRLKVSATVLSAAAVKALQDAAKNRPVPK
jgi:hypothetical protein